MMNRFFNGLAIGGLLLIVGPLTPAHIFVSLFIIVCVWSVPAD